MKKYVYYYRLKMSVKGLFRLLFTSFYLAYMKFSVCLSVFLLSLSFASAQSEKDIQSRNIQSVKLKIWDSDNSKNNENTLSHYDKKGNITEFISFDKDSIPEKWEQYTYNNSGDVLEEKKLDEKGKVKKVTTYSYNHLGKKTEEKQKDAEGKLIYTITYEYNGFDQKVAEIKTDAEGNLKEKNVYEYDNKGMLTSKKTFNKKGELVYSKSFVYTY